MFDTDTSEAKAEKQSSKVTEPGLPKRPVPSFVSEGSSAPQTGVLSMDRKVVKKVWTPKRITSIGAVALFVGLVAYTAIFGDHSSRLNVQVERITISQVTRSPFQEFIVQRGTVMEFISTPPKRIRRGQTEQIRLALDAPQEALLLARGGFYQTTGGNWVFVVEGDDAVRRDVRIGRQNPEYFEVIEGLVPGERVVTSSYENYEEIDKLALKQ